jgi:hypothetical protein
MTKCGCPAARLNLKLPVESHLKSPADTTELFVAIAPLADEDEVDKVVAFSNGKRLRLDPATPPKTPTLVIVGDEPQSIDPGYPLPISKNPGREENPKRPDDYVGIPWIYLYNDSESWTCGDPEIYVRIMRFRFSTFSLINQWVDLPGVNDERVWYNLGDWNPTYRYVTTSDYAPVVRFEFWEADSGWHGADDFLGAINITWTGLPYSGYRYYTAGDVRFGVDRD